MAIIIDSALLLTIAEYTPFVVTIIASVIGAAAYIKKFNNNKIDEHREELLGRALDGSGGYIGEIKHNMNNGFQELHKKIDVIKASNEVIKSYIEEDIKEIKEEVTYLRRIRNGNALNYYNDQHDHDERMRKE